MLSTLRMISIALVAAFFALLAFSQLTAVDEAVDRRYRHDLRRLEALDATLSGELLKSRSGLVAHYDSLVRILSALKAQRNALQVVPGYLSDEGRRENRATQQLPHP